MFQLPSISGPLPFQKLAAQRRMSDSTGMARPPPPSDPLRDMRRPSSDGRATSAGRKRRNSKKGGSARRIREPERASAGGANDVMYLVPHDKDEAKAYKSTLVFCQVKLKEATVNRKQRAAESGEATAEAARQPDSTSTAACCHVLDTLSEELNMWPPFVKIMRRLRDEVLYSVFSDHVQPIDAPPYLRRVPWHALAKQLQSQLNEKQRECAELEAQLAASRLACTEMENVIIQARVLKLDTEKEVEAQRHTLSRKDAEMVQVREDMTTALAERDNANRRAQQLNDALEKSEFQASDNSSLRKERDEAVENEEALRGALLRRGNEVQQAEDELEELEVKVKEQTLVNASWAKQNAELRNQLADASTAAAQSGRGGNKAGELQQITDLKKQVMELEAKLKDSASDGTITCLGTHEGVPAYLRWTGEVRRSPCTLGATHSQLRDMWQERVRRRPKPGATPQPVTEWLADYLRARWPTDEGAATAGYNLYTELTRHAKGGVEGGGPDALCALTLSVLDDERHERHYDDLCSMVGALERLLVQLPAKDGGKAVGGPEVARRAIQVQLEDFFPSLPTDTMRELRTALSQDHEGGGQVLLRRLFDGGVGNGSVFLRELCAVYLQSADEAAAALDKTLRAKAEGEPASVSAQFVVEALGTCKVSAGVGADAVALVARATGRSAGDILGPKGAKPDVKVEALVDALRKSGCMRGAELWKADLSVKMVGAAPSAGTQPAVV